MNRRTLDIIDDAAQRAGELHCRLVEEIDPADAELAQAVRLAARLLDQVDRVLSDAFLAAHGQPGEAMDPTEVAGDTPPESEKISL